MKQYKGFLGCLATDHPLLQFSGQDLGHVVLSRAREAHRVEDRPHREREVWRSEGRERGWDKLSHDTARSSHLYSCNTASAAGS